MTLTRSKTRCSSRSMTMIWAVGLGLATQWMAFVQGQVNLPQRRNTWSRVSKLVPPNGTVTTGAQMGFAIAVSINTTLLGSPRAIVGGKVDAGIVFVFDQSINSTFLLQAQLTPNDTQPTQYFGTDVDIEEDLAVIGARGDNQNDVLFDVGAAYVFLRDYVGGLPRWTQMAKLIPSVFKANSNFGLSVSLSGNTIAAGAQNEPNTDGIEELPSAGYTYVFTGSGANWTLQARLGAPDPGPNDFFGSDVKVQDDVLLIGAKGDDEGQQDSGSLYVFNRTGKVWNQIQKIRASDAAIGDSFGTAVDMSGERFVVTNAPRISTAGGVYVFQLNGTTGLYDEESKIVASRASQNDYFACSISFEKRVLAIGAYEASGSQYGLVNTVTGRINVGATFIYYLNSRGTWKEIDRIVPNRFQGLPGDRFGYAVAVQGDSTALIGAPFDNTAGTGAGSVAVYTGQIQLIFP